MLGDVSDAADTLAAAVRRLESILGTYTGFGQAVFTMKIAMRALGCVQAEWRRRESRAIREARSAGRGALHVTLRQTPMHVGAGQGLCLN